MGQRYSDYLFQELCGELLDVYSEFIESLQVRSTQRQLSEVDAVAARLQSKRQQNQQQQQAATAALTPRLSLQQQGHITSALTQAKAEYDYFKVCDHLFFQSPRNN